MNEFVLDIEVIPNPELTVVQRDLVESKLENKKTTFDKFSALNPEFGKIVCICLQKNNLSIIVHSEKNESELLKSFWEELKEGNYKLISFNGKAFDIPYIIKRSIINNILPTTILPHKRYDLYKHFDVFEVLANFNTFNQVFSLNEYCTIFGIIDNDTHTGKDVSSLYQSGDLQGIISHCIHDIIKTQQLYQKIKQFYTI